MQLTLPKLLLLTTITIGFSTSTSNAVFAYSPGTSEAAAAKGVLVADSYNQSEFQAQLPNFPSPPDRWDNRSGDRSRNRDDVKHCLNKDDRNDRQDCLENLRDEVDDHRRDSNDDIKHCLDKSDRDDRRECLEDLWNDR